MYYIWPPIQSVIYSVGNVVLNSGYVGTWIYGVMERALIPFGLHHVFYLPFWQTAVGGTMEVGGRLVEGAQNIFFAQLADPTVDAVAVSATRFMSGKFPVMIFGLPGAALAMYKTARPGKTEGCRRTFTFSGADVHVDRNYGTAGVYLFVCSACPVCDSLCFCRGGLYADAYI